MKRSYSKKGEKPTRNKYGFFVYSKEVLAETQLLPCDVAGAWLKFLFKVDQNKQRGVFKGTLKEFAVLFSESDLDKAKHYIKEIKNRDVGEVLFDEKTGIYTIINRRMFDEYKKAERAKECSRASSKTYRNKNKEKIREISRLYRRKPFIFGHDKRKGGNDKPLPSLRPTDRGAGDSGYQKLGKLWGITARVEYRTVMGGPYQHKINPETIKQISDQIYLLDEGGENGSDELFIRWRKCLDCSDPDLIKHSHRNEFFLTVHHRYSGDWEKQVEEMSDSQDGDNTFDEWVARRKGR